MATATLTSNFSVNVPDKVKPILTQSRALSQDERSMEFTPAVHLSFKEPSEILMMKDLALPEDNGVSPMAVSQPFQLFSQSAIDRMRDEILSDDVSHSSFRSSDLPFMAYVH